MLPICRLSNLVLVLLVNDGEYHNGIIAMSMSAFSPAGITQPWNHGCNVAAFVHTPEHTHTHPSLFPSLGPIKPFASALKSDILVDIVKKNVGF
jgi:hypothetical protein